MIIYDVVYAFVGISFIAGPISLAIMLALLVSPIVAVIEFMEYLERKDRT